MNNHRSNYLFRYRSGGLTYLSLLLVLALLSLAAMATLQLASFAQRRAAEEELLFIGQEFQRALLSYANATPPGGNKAPPSLDELLRDKRTPTVRRHLRKLYIDPIRLKPDWGLITLPDGKGIVGIHSKSDRQPIKIAQFPVSMNDFENKKSYEDWVFKTP
ncbi:type II secretion system protein [Undibacterium sp. Ji50W]|uniref:type II secretion system protein n=1 Tax=Undibacterium sp. Ji50W TaxID=3413041 RepID=UPI003BF28046